MKRGTFLYLFLLFLLGCTTPPPEMPVEEEIKSAAAELQNLSDEEIQAEIEAQESGMAIAGQAAGRKYSPSTLKKVLEHRQTQRIPVYEITLNPQNWRIKKMRLYYQDRKTEAFFTWHLQQERKIQEKDPTTYWLLLTSGEKEYRIPFSKYQRYVVEDFRPGKVQLIKADKEVKPEIVVRLKTEQLLTGKFTLSIINNNGQTEKRIPYSLKDNFLISPDNTGVELITPATLTTCGSELVEIIPGHNRVDSNRINLIFTGTGYWSTLEFVPHLPDFVDFNGDGFYASTTVIIRGSSESYVESDFFNGILGEEPFRSNRDSFNFWYLDQLLELRIPPEVRVRDYPSTSCREFGPEELPLDCALPNTFVINLINQECRGWGYFGGDSFVSFVPPDSDRDWVKGWTIRTIVHELGHSIGSLLDEYVEDGEGDQSGFPNCASDIEEATEFLFENEAYLGCSYIYDNLRATENSLMNYQFPEANFDYLNEFHLCSVLFELTGQLTPGSCTRELLVDPSARLRIHRS